MKWKLGLFDWNGTLFDDLNLMYEAILAIFSYYCLPPPTLEEFRDETDADFMPFYHKRGIPLEVSAADLMEIRARVVNGQWQMTKLHTHVKPLLWICRESKIKRVIVSAENPIYLEERILRFDLTSFLDEFRGGVINKKIVFLEMMEKFAANPKETFYVDDNPGLLRVAQEMGITTFGVTHGYASREKIASAQPDYVVESLYDVSLIIVKGGTS